MTYVYCLSLLTFEYMQSLAGESVVVIGSGIGGLSTACYLADAGADVRVVEQNEQLGGRASRLERDGFRFDMGPSWYLMPDVFERFFDDFDRTPSEYYELTHLDPHYRIFFKDGDQVDITPELERTKSIFEEYEQGAGETLERYLEKSEENYEIGMRHFVYEDRPRLRDYMDLDVARNARGLSLIGSMQGHVENYFEHPKLQQIMQYTLVFLGGSPTNTPALYNLMSHVDFNLGVWYPEGGIGEVVDAFVDLGRELGVEYETDRPVTQIKGREGAFLVETPTGALRPDLVVSNADYAHTEQELLPPERRGYDADYWESRTYAPSAFLLYLGVEGDVDDSPIIRLFSRRSGTSTSNRFSTSQPGPTIRPTTSVSPRQPTTTLPPTVTARCSSWSRSRPASRTPPRSETSTAISSSRIWPRIRGRTCVIESSSRNAFRWKISPVGTTVSTGLPSGLRIRFGRPRFSGRHTGRKRSMDSTSSAETRRLGSACRCV